MPTPAPSVLFDGSSTEPKTVSELVGQAVGAASVCWEDMTGTGVFQDDRARVIVDDVLAALAALGIDASTPLQRGTVPS